jgi:adenylate cyclase
MSASNKSTLSSFFKKNGTVIVICLVLNALIGAFMWLHITSRLGNLGQGVIAMENLLLDYRFVLRGNIKPSGKIGILGIDEKSIQKFGRWPFTRSVYEQAFANLKKAGAEWIGFDVIWDKPELPLLADAEAELSRFTSSRVDAQGVLKTIQALKENSRADQSLSRAIRDYGKVVQGYMYFGKDEAENIAPLKGREFASMDLLMNSAVAAAIMPDGFDLNNYPELKVGAVITNTPMIAQSSSEFGFFNNEAVDSVVRWASLLMSANNNLMPSVSLKMAANMTGRNIVAMFGRIGVDELMLSNPEDDADVISIPVDPLGGGQIMINHLGPTKTLTHISLADAWDDAFSDQERRRIKGMSFLMGPTAMAINDIRANPFDSKFDGVENHATVIDNIVSKRFFKRPADIYKLEMRIVGIVGLIFSLVLILTSPLISAAAVVAFYVGYYYLDKHLWFSKGIWVYMGLPYIQITGMYMVVTFYRYLTEEREKKKIKGAFQHYLSPDVMNQVLDDPEKLKLGGERRECSVFFSDVRGFTTISESLPPEKLVELMNDYLSPMTEIILRSGGVLDKYIGDAIMAFWGAPIERPDQADVAAQVVLQMMEKLEELRRTFPQKGFPPIDIGCGVNTGFMSVGNMGSSERFAYTVMGDAVNLSARLESITKEYGVRSIFSEYTIKKLKNPHSYLLRDMDDIVVKGKKEPVKIFELIHPMILRSEDQVRDLIGEFHLARDYYKQQKWDNAKNHLSKCLMIRPSDEPSQLYLERIEEFQASPPGDDWNGIYVFHHK